MKSYFSALTILCAMSCMYSMDSRILQRHESACCNAIIQKNFENFERSLEALFDCMIPCYQLRHEPAQYCINPIQNLFRNILRLTPEEPRFLIYFLSILNKREHDLSVGSFYLWDALMQGYDSMVLDEERTFPWIVMAADQNKQAYLLILLEYSTQLCLLKPQLNNIFVQCLSMAMRTADDDKIHKILSDWLSDAYTLSRL